MRSAPRAGWPAVNFGQAHTRNGSPITVMQRGTGSVPLRKSFFKAITKRYSLFLYPVKESHFCEPESFFRLTVSLPGQGKSFSQIAAARSHLKLCWRRLAAAEAGVAAPGAAGMPVRWPRRPAAVSEAVVAGAGPDFSCAAGQKRAAKPPNRRGKVSLGGLCVSQWVCR